MTYDEALERMAIAICKCTHEDRWYLEEARAAAEAIGLREMVEALNDLAQLKRCGETSRQSRDDG